MPATSLIDLAQGWHIKPPGTTDAHPAAETAVRELRTALEALAPATSGSADANPLSFVLRHRATGSDGYSWNISGNKVQLDGNSARGLLNAVYAFLGELGFAWPGHRPIDACLPAGSRFSVKQVSADAPSFAGRCLILGHHAFLCEHGDWITWAARNRLNTIFVHTAEEGLALGAVPAAQWRASAEEIRQQCARFGMTLELGGHGLSRLLPRDLFETMPDAFRMKEGKRTPDHNLDPLNTQGMEVVRKNARDWFQANPGADVYHLWPDDIPGGGWSQGPETNGLSASDQALIATNILAEELERISPDAQIAHIAYHDTEPVPTAVRPRANTSLLWAPRMRSYAQGVFDTRSSVNARYPDELAANLALFADAGARPARVFEYYLDAILFKSTLPPFAALIAQDAAGYAAAGIHTLQALMVGGRPWNAPQLNAYAFARLAWNCKADPVAITRDFAAAVAGVPAADALTTHYESLSDAFCIALDFEPAEARPGAAAGAAEFLDNPPTDMGDPWHAAPDDIKTRLALMPAVTAKLDQAATALGEAAARATVTRHLAGLQAEFALARLWFDFHFARLALYDILSRHKTAPDTKACEKALATAYAICGAVDEWADNHIADPRYIENTKLLHWLFWRIRLDAIRESLTPEGAARDAVRKEREADMQIRFARGRMLWTEQEEG